MTISSSGIKLIMVPPPVLPSGKCAVHSPPGRRSTTAPGVSHVLRPSLVANACQTAARGAGTAMVRTKALSVVDEFVFAFPGVWEKAVAQVSSRMSRMAFMILLDELVERSSKSQYDESSKGFIYAEGFAHTRPAD